MEAIRQIHCPDCGVRLSVPNMAAEHAARCPACHTIFRVPSPVQMLDETVVCWLDLDAIEDAQHRRDLDEEDEGPVIDAQMAAPAEADAATPGADVQEGEPSIDDELDAVFARTVEPSVDPAPEVGRVTPSPADGPGGNGAVTGGEAAPSDGPATANTPKVQVRHHPSPPGHVPRLEVLQVGAFGVRFAFPAHALDWPGFRASMPMCGIISGESDPKKLRARPLAWRDKATGHLTDPAALEGRYEYRIRARMTPREVVAAMATMDELPQPFNQPMPYYVAHEDIGKITSIHCQTAASPTGIQCEVTIPSVAYALDWLGRVNGICGEDYADLEFQAHRYESGAWRSIPDSVRHRLTVWFEFEGDEQFVAYFNDADFSSKDAGLAGMIVTTRRLVWAKYHRHGSIRIDRSAELHAVNHGPYATLEYRSPKTQRQLLRIRHSDVQPIADALAKASAALTVKVAEATGVSVDDED